MPTAARRWRHDPVQLRARRRRRRRAAPRRARGPPISRRRHQPRRPDARDDRAARRAGRRHRPAGRDRGDRRGRPADRRRGAQHARSPSIAPSATAIPCWRARILAGASAQIRNMATVGGNLLQRTRCAYFYDNDGSRCNKRAPGRAATRSTGSTASMRSSARRRPASRRTRPTCASRWPRWTRRSTCRAHGARTVPFAELHRLPGEQPELETMLAPGELITAIELPALPAAARSTYRKVRDRASYAFALVSVAAVLELDGDRIATCGSRSAASRTSRGVRRRRKRAARRPGDRGGVPRRRRRRTRRCRAAARQRFQGRARHTDPRRRAWRPCRSDSMSILDAAKGAAQATIQAAMGKLVPLAPDSWIPGGIPDPLIRPQAWRDRRAAVAARRAAQGAGRRTLRGRIPARRHGLCGARLQHHPARADRRARHRGRRSRARAWCW